jgi:hypothetical protein
LLQAGTTGNTAGCWKLLLFYYQVTLLNDCYQCIIISYKMHTWFLCFYFKFYTCHRSFNSCFFLPPYSI